MRTHIYIHTVETYDKKLRFSVQESGFFLFPAGYIYTALEEESDFHVKIAQFRRPEVENRGSRFLIVGFLIVCLHRSL